MKNKYFVYLIIFTPLLIFLISELSIYLLKDNLTFTNSVINARNNNIKCLIMGDSHTQNAFSNNIPNCYNLSIGGSSIPMIIDAVEDVIKNNPVKKIIIPLEPHDFSKYRELNYSPMYKNISKNFTPMYQPLFNIIPIREEMKDYIEKIFDAKRKKFIWSNVSKEEKTKRINNRLKIHTDLDNFESSNYSKIYQKMIKNLLHNNIKAILVRTPVVEEYEKNLFKKLNKQRWDNFIKQFEQLGATYINYKELNINNKKDNLFTDEDHLNKEGSKIYSNKFNDYILKLDII